MQIDPAAKVLVVLGVALILIGIGWQWGWIQTLKLGRLPGDIFIENENSKIFIPITTMILVSVVLSALSWIARRFF